MKKFLLYLLIILFLISVYKDITIGTEVKSNEQEKKVVVDTEHNMYQAVKVKVSHGETVLSVVERLNNFESAQLDVNRILSDFKQLNPHVDPYNIKSNSFYYFPMYNE
ncbi:hypothetical protein GMD78_01665 [Ornithinibacillus sp. L9]|uniref:LysM domain-containing protein n=1 Tax=Ornithinibacillus caprae TaxID=2678566 RepID=A0A6N8FD62_9BACI|nr:hypothetical protein [Ornithinibacillus caprae]MUK87111.1 hypothetical protein [Ornithinibacillus caprae]